MPYQLYLKKQDFKFSSSHFTIFNETHAEHLHGHNYSLAIKIKLASVDDEYEMSIDFNTIKDHVREICKKLDEKILIPKNSPLLKIQNSPHYKSHIEVLFNDRNYCFPEDEIFFIPVNNITSEALSRFIYQKLKTKLPSAVQKFSVSVFETAGQAASYTE